MNGRRAHRWRRGMCQGNYAAYCKGNFADSMAVPLAHTAMMRLEYLVMLDISSVRWRLTLDIAGYIDIIIFTVFRSAVHVTP
jgi:hypothetical protein